MKPARLFVLILFVTALQTHVYAIVDPTTMYQNMERRINEIRGSRSQLADSLISVNLAKDERRQLKEWDKSLEEEQVVLEKRLELFKKLQDSGIITYIAPGDKNTKMKTGPSRHR